ncbi:movement protein [Soybean chlorotic blotch virus]|uniref:Movement protein BC1 n=1 Tax=Soybean chlorotic blotch virus TaxID=761702 RepID=D6MTX3_9GEMI|nr:movement protein [Soybean chlorotic blotch virus]ADG36423.1 movement protein [Soybean chlorotic blotch virus]
MLRSLMLIENFKCFHVGSLNFCEGICLSSQKLLSDLFCYLFHIWVLLNFRENRGAARPDFGMEDFSVVSNKYIESRRNEYALTNDATTIKLEFPTTLEQATVRLKGKCMKIDHIVIEYRNQVPFNATGSVVVEIRDHRLRQDECAQARFSFPITCNVNLHYYSSSFFSLKDKSPWELVYMVEDSNVNEGTMFAMIKAKLKLSSAKHSTDIRFKPPNIHILSKGFNSSCVDFWTVNRPKLERRLLDQGPNSSNANEPMLGRIELLPGETWASRSTISAPMQKSASMRITRPINLMGNDISEEAHSDADHPYRTLNRLPTTALEPGDSVSQVQSDNVSRKELESIIEATINKCLIKERPQALKEL